MLSDEQVIEMVRSRLASDLADLVPPPSLLDRVRAQTGPRFAKGSDHRPFRPTELITAALSCVVVLAVAAGALALLRSSRPSSQATGSSGLQALVGKLGVFDTTQTAAAGAYNAQTKRRFFARLTPIARWTRAVPVSGGATVYLYVTRSGAGYGLGATERSSTQGVGSCCLTARDLDHPRGPAIQSGYQSGHYDTVYYEVVPNRVARVRWFFPMNPEFVGGGPVPQFSHALTVTAPVHDNVAAIRIPQRGAPTHEYWQDASGRVLASTALRFPGPKPTPGSVTAAIKTQDQAIQRSIAVHHLLSLRITSPRAATRLAAILRSVSPAQAKRLLPELQALSTTFTKAALAVSSKKPSSATQKQAQRDWVAGTQGLATPAPFLAGLADILYHRETATIALRRQQTRVVESDRLRAKADKILHIATSS